MSSRLLYLCPTPAPYRNAEIDRVAERLGAGALETVFESATHATANWRQTLPARCPYHVLESLHGLESFLDSRNPAAVIVGSYRSPAGRRVLDWCGRSGRPYCLRSDSNVWTDRAAGFLARGARRILLAPRVRRARRCLVTGSYNRLFWRRYGMRPEQEGWWPQWIDYDHWERAAGRRGPQREAERRRYRITTRFTMLYFGRLIPRKNVDVLCQAVSRLPPDVGLVVAGDGESGSRLRERYAGRSGDRIRFVGAVEPSDAPGLFSAVDALALASGANEPWGMVVNEACAAGLPILCGPHVGAAGDLVSDRENGVLVERDEPVSWAVAVRRLVEDPDSAARMGERSRDIVAAWRERSKPEECVARLIRDLELEA